MCPSLPAPPGDGGSARIHQRPQEWGPCLGLSAREDIGNKACSDALGPTQVRVLSHRRLGPTAMRAEVEMTMEPPAAVDTAAHALLRLSHDYANVNVRDHPTRPTNINAEKASRENVSH